MTNDELRVQLTAPVTPHFSLELCSKSDRTVKRMANICFKASVKEWPAWGVYQNLGCRGHKMGNKGTCHMLHLCTSNTSIFQADNKMNLATLKEWVNCPSVKPYVRLSEACFKFLES